MLQFSPTKSISISNCKWYSLIHTLVPKRRVLNSSVGSNQINKKWNCFFLISLSKNYRAKLFFRFWARFKVADYIHLLCPEPHLNLSLFWVLANWIGIEDAQSLCLTAHTLWKERFAFHSFLWHCVDWVWRSKWDQDRKQTIPEQKTISRNY